MQIERMWRRERGGNGLHGRNHRAQFMSMQLGAQQPARALGVVLRECCDAGAVQRFLVAWCRRHDVCGLVPKAELGKREGAGVLGGFQIAKCADLDLPFVAAPKRTERWRWWLCSRHT